MSARQAIRVVCCGEPIAAIRIERGGLRMEWSDRDLSIPMSADGTLHPDRQTWRTDKFYEVLVPEAEILPATPAAPDPDRRRRVDHHRSIRCRGCSQMVDVYVNGPTVRDAIRRNSSTIRLR